MKYSVDIHEMVFPKYAKLQFKVNRAGNLTLIASPSYTPGKLPDGLKPGQIPKGTRIFDYDSQIVVSLTFQDCLLIQLYFQLNLIQGKNLQEYCHSTH